MGTNKAFIILLNVKEEIVSVNSFEDACVEKLSTNSLNQTSKKIANAATTENTSKPQEFGNANNNCVLLRCFPKTRQKYTNTDKWWRQERQTILSQVYFIHQQPIKLSTHQIINIAKTPNDYFIITQNIWTFEASCEHRFPIIYDDWVLHPTILRQPRMWERNTYNRKEDAN